MIVTRLARWCGFAVTVAALLAFAAWWRRLGTSLEPHVTVTRVARDLALFAVFAGHHSVFARRTVKAVVVRLVPPELERTVYVCAASVLLVVVSRFWTPIGGVVYAVDLPFAVVFYGLQVAGAIVGLLAMRHFSVGELVGVKASDPVAQLEHKGPYRVVRHPLYTSLVLMLAATPHMTGDRFLLVVLLLAYLGVAIPLEERSLTDQFGDAYRSYRARVAWRLIPYIH